jgi:hypothetical protein
MDRWYAQFTLWNDIQAAGSGSVSRVRDNSVYRVIEDRPLDEQRGKASAKSRKHGWKREDFDQIP